MYLYVLQFDRYCKNTVKIGYANSPEGRLLTLQKTHGNGRLLLKCCVGDIANRLEKTLHLLYKDQNTDRLEGDGGTEFFKFEDVGVTIKHIRYIAESFDAQNSIEKMAEHSALQDLRDYITVLESNAKLSKETLDKALADKYWLMTQITRYSSIAANTTVKLEGNTKTKQKGSLKKRLLYAILDIEQ